MQKKEKKGTRFISTIFHNGLELKDLIEEEVLLLKKVYGKSEIKTKGEARLINNPNLLPRSL